MLRHSYGQAQAEEGDYERAWFDAGHSNWPDLRRPEPRSFAASWGHGAPGTALARPAEEAWADALGPVSTGGAPRLMYHGMSLAWGDIGLFQGLSGLGTMLARAEEPALIPRIMAPGA